MRRMALHVSHDGFAGQTSRSMDDDATADVLGDFEEVLHALAALTDGNTKVTAVIKALGEDCGQSDLASRVCRASSRRNGRAHPDWSLLCDVKALALGVVRTRAARRP
uniref:Uncharacterized protein n=1 Tax=Alexandrium monilatum TaxID=311494 RepID=A0A7S4PYL1_9DINO